MQHLSEKCNFQVSPGSAEALVRRGGKITVHVDCLLSPQHLCQKLSQMNSVCKDYSKSKVGRFFETQCRAYS